MANTVRGLRNPRLHRWTDLPKQEGLLVFAQRLTEALWDYSLDTYKAPALNTHTRTIELLEAVTEAESGHIAERSLTSIAHELARSIATDHVARELIGPASYSLQREEWWEVKNPERLRRQASIVRGALWHRRYEQAIRVRLQEIVPEGKRKEDILRLTSDLIVEWGLLGFSRDAMFHRAKTYFFGILPDPVPPYALVEFLSLFDEDPKTFEVVIKGSADWNNVSTMFPSTMLKVLSEAPSPKTAMRLENEFLRAEHDGTYLAVGGISAYDARSASDRVIERLRGVQGILRLHRHRADLSWNARSLVYEGEHPVVLNPASSALLKEEDCADDDFESRVFETLQSLTFETTDEGASRMRLFAALGLHTSAMDSDEDTVQLSTLWSAIESILPRTSEEARIVGIIERVVPVMSQRYPMKLIDNLHKSLQISCAVEYANALEQIDGDSFLEKCSALTILSEHFDKRKSLYAALERNPLLKFRLSHLNKSLQTAPDVLTMVESHKVRVKAHLERVYRSRNLFVHAGRALRYRKTLAENVHSYFHVIMRTVTDAFSVTPEVTDLDTLFYKVRIEHEAHIRALRNAGKDPLTREGLRPALVGPGGAWKVG